MRHHATFLVSAAALLSACGPGEPAPVPPPPDDTPEVSASDPAMPDGTGEIGPATTDAPETSGPASSEFDIDAALSEPVADGEWVTQPNWTGFGPPNSEALFMVQCGEYGMIRLTRMMDIDPATPAPAAIAAGDRIEQGFWKPEDGDELPSADFEIYAEAPIFDAMMEADKIAILAEGKPPLAVPGSQQLDEQIDSCRNRGSGTP